MRDETSNNKKRWLYRYRNTQKKIIRLQSKLDTLNNRITSAKTTNISGLPRGGVPVTIDDLISDKQILEERIEKLEKNKRIYRREILEAIDDLEDCKHAEILEAWFIDGYNAEEISKEIGYCSRHVFRLYDEALKELRIPEQ